jgi:2-polyprenyl-6-methoxyphenol hydroxylase-like FAD-dependent oxidoreductase
MGEEANRYDVIIVGGRPAGAWLAARLGREGVRTLVFDRAEMPSLPAVPSCPVLYPSGMKLLDEIGVDDREYAPEEARMRRLYLEFGDWFTASMPTVPAFGRDFVAGIDRATFDHALWKNLARFPSVTARAGLTFVDLVRDEGGRVIGVEARAGDGPVERFFADWVVGADGRFSPVARKAGAKVIEDRAEHTSTVHYADWEGIEPFDDSGVPAAIVHATGRGADVLHLAAPGGRITVCTHVRSDRADVGGDAEAYYLGTLKRLPRLERARRVTPIVGVKRVANRYLESGGPGWVLVGDALHHKDPVDGQGIYDALVEGKVLAEALLSVRAGERTAAAALAFYDRRVREETYAMFLATMDRLKRELYDEPPEIVIRTLLRWLVNDPEYQHRFLSFLTRTIPPENWLPSSLLRAAAMRGAMGDARRLAARWLGKGRTDDEIQPRPGAAAG